MKAQNRRDLKKWIWSMMKIPDLEYVIFKMENHLDRDITPSEIDRADRALQEINRSMICHRGEHLNRSRGDL